MGEAARQKLFPGAEHRKAADTFAQHVDKHRTQTGDFIFRSANGGAILLSNAAINSALLHHTQTAQALAKVVTLDVGSRKHQSAVQTLLQLVHHLEAEPRKFNTKLIFLADVSELLPLRGS
jgi:hypothetical protein